MSTNPLSLGRKAKPTQHHLPVIWENMLGTVYARNAEGVITYFDYDWDGAVKFADVHRDADPRTARCQYGYYGSTGPRRGQLALFVRR